ncbi:zinc-ribbon domain-containing protein [Leifsonia sp. NPDC058292]|uniref:zinc-ribbon domain-containing protein n=1 Tax=Leifsonia sp. NPDC058292 TaxID=3346428 RepID=UPI0036DB2BE5
MSVDEFGVRSLPWIPRITHLETAVSYAHRLEAANFVPHGFVARIAQMVRASSSEQLTSEDAFHRALDLLTAGRWTRAQSAFKSSSARLCTPSEKTELAHAFERQASCPRCVPGEYASTTGHWFPLICSRHKMWLHPGNAGATVRGTTRQAHSRLQRLLRRHPGISWKFFGAAWEVAELILNQLGREVDSQDTFVLTVSLLTVYLHTRGHLADTRLTLRQIYEQCEERLAQLPDDVRQPVLDAVWQMNYSNYVAQYEWLTNRNDDVLALVGGSNHLRLTGAIHYPLEPPSRYLTLVRSSIADEDVAYRVRHAVVRKGHQGRRDNLRFICSQGHATARSADSIASTRYREDEGCPVCMGFIRRRGVNSIYELAPRDAARWDVIKNGGPPPGNLPFTNGSYFWWRCEEGHSYRATVRAQLERHLCPECHRSGGGVTDTYNVAHSFPEVAKMWWADTYAPVTPDVLPPHSKQWFWWHCTDCHQYFYEEVARLVCIRSCPYCAGRETMPGLNDIDVSNPCLSPFWDDEANGFPSYLVGPGLTWRARWRCEEGHEYLASHNEAVGNVRRCRACARTVLIQGVTDIAHAYPEWRDLWDPALNLGLQADSALAAGDAIHGWRCDKGHPYWKSIRDMRRNSECSVCLNKRCLAHVNDLRSRYGPVVDDWDIAANLGLSPELVLPGNRPRFWTCLRGHTRWERPINRRRTGGCPDCPKADRVAFASAS